MKGLLSARALWFNLVTLLLLTFWNGSQGKVEILMCRRSREGEHGDWRVCAPRFVRWAPGCVTVSWLLTPLTARYQPHRAASAGTRLLPTSPDPLIFPTVQRRTLTLTFYLASLSSSKAALLCFHSYTQSHLASCEIGFQSETSLQRNLSI